MSVVRHWRAMLCPNICVQITRALMCPNTSVNDNT